MGREMILGAVNFMGGFSLGYNSGVIAGVLNIFHNEDPSSQWYLSQTSSTDKAVQGIVTASILIGALFGSMIGGPIADKFGRRFGVASLSVLTLIFAPLVAAAPNMDLLIVARAFLGIPVGMSGVICPMYVSESASPDKKGPLGILFQLAITIGILIAYVINYALEYVTYNWRLMFGLGGVPALGLLLITFAMPESPVWALNKRGISGEGAPLMRTNEAAAPLGERLGIFVRSRALYIGLVLAIAQQLTGINAFMFYAGGFFSTAGISNLNYPTMGLGLWNAISTMIAVPLVDKLGRRPLLIVGTTIMSVACFGIGLVLQFTSGATLNILSILLLFLFVAAFEVGDGPLFWIVAHELFTPETKTVGASTLNAAQWIFNITLTLGFPIVESAIGGNVFYIFGGVGAFTVIIMFFALPETRNMSKYTTI